LIKFGEIVLPRTTKIESRVGDDVGQIPTSENAYAVQNVRMTGCVAQAPEA
jgi:hypothetical protein